MRNAECGMERIGRSLPEPSPEIPHSALRIPRLLAGVVLLALATPHAGAQQPAQHPDSTPKDTTTLAPVVVTGVRLPTVRELARGLAGRTASLDAQDLNALGAAVNLVTRRGASPAAREIEASAGSWDRYELKARAGGRHGVWDYYVGARYEREGGWREDTRSRIGTLFAKLGLLNGTWDATLSYSGADNRIFQAGSLPESVAAATPRRNFTGGDYFAPQAHLVILNAQRLVGRTQLAINAFGRSLSSEQFNANFVGADSRQRNATRIAGGAVQLSGKLPLGARALRWLAGADADYEHVAVHIFAAPGGGSPDSLTESVRTNQVNGGAFAGANLEVVPRLTATAAARYDWIRVPFEDLIDATQSGLHIFRRLSPRAGLTWSGGRRAPGVANAGPRGP